MQPGVTVERGPACPGVTVEPSTVQVTQLLYQTVLAGGVQLQQESTVAVVDSVTAASESPLVAHSAPEVRHCR
jgi:hypothetical protein